MQTTQGVSNFDKSFKIISELQTRLRISPNPRQKLHNICRTLLAQDDPSLTDIANTMLMKLGSNNYVVYTNYYHSV